MSSPVTPTEIERLKALRSALAPEEGLKTVDTYASSLLAAAATVGTLGAAFNVIGDDPLAGAGQGLFLGSIVLVGLSLALAIWAVVPSNVSYNPNSIQSMEGAIGDLLKRRKRVVVAAGVLFGLALVTAAIAPILSSMHDEEKASGITFETDASGTVSASLAVANGEELSSAKIRLSLLPASEKTRRAAQTFTDSDGDGVVSAEIKPESKTRAVSIRGFYEDADGKEQEEIATVPVR